MISNALLLLSLFSRFTINNSIFDEKLSIDIVSDEEFK